MILAPSINDYYIKSKLDPQLELQTTLKNMANISSYKYSLKSILHIDSREEVISEVEGEKSKGNTHIKGEMVNTSIDIYYIDRTIYNYDAFSKKWLVIDSSTNNSEELLISELNPLSNFKFKQLNTVEKINFEKIDGVECMLVSCQPSVDSELLETLWKNMEYQIWVDYQQDLIRKASLKAINKKVPSTSLSVEVEITDFNKNIQIEAPDSSNNKK
ncbi:MAG: hypothetical protein PHC92_00580 [Syntrophomonadaceae bacterium]|nr:hypothetical protein [Syntrophomonadaceae bacterium]MDD3022416.1 hypothetical protein [Syntrophomonadaceae bacterium]